MLETSDIKVKRAERALEVKPDYDSISGCTRGNKFKTKDSLQLSYSKEELSKYLSPRRSRRDLS